MWRGNIPVGAKDEYEWVYLMLDLGQRSSSLHRCTNIFQRLNDYVIIFICTALYFAFWSAELSGLVSCLRAVSKV